MRIINNRRFRHTAGLSIALLASASAVPAFAQDQAADAAESGDIIVTAQKREQALQDVPIALSAIGSEELAERNISDVRSLSGSVPSLSITGSATVSGNSLISIRGISNQPAAIGVPQTVAIYIDGEYQPGPFSAFFALDDVQRIEVLRGPQGTLYGRNASAGTINIVTRMPGDELKGGIDVSYGNYDRILAKGSISGPLGGGFSAGFSGAYERRDGYFTNITTGNRIGGMNTYTARGKLRYQSPEGKFSALFSIDTSRRNGSDAGGRSIYSGTNAYFGYGQPYALQSTALAEQKIRGFRRSTGGALTLNYEVSSDFDVTSLTSLRDEATDGLYDFSGAPVGAVTLPVQNQAALTKTDKTFYQELRGHYNKGGLDVTFGFNYFRNKETYGAAVQPMVLNLPVANPFDTSTVNNWALFGQVDYEVTDQLTVTLGGRLNEENRDYLVDYTRGFLPTGAPYPFVPRLMSGKIKETKFIPSGGINYEFTRDIMVYAKISKGYQAPGFNATPGAAPALPAGVPVPSIEFAAEDLTAYEAGIKTQFADRRITLNLAGFHYSYTNLQVRNVTGPGQSLVTNAGKAKVDGFEASGSVKVSSVLNLSGNLSWTNARYTEFCELASGSSASLGRPACTTSTGAAGWNRAGNMLINAPKWQWNLAANFTQPVGDTGELRANLSYSYTGNTFYTSSNDPLTSSLGAAKRLDGRIGFQFKSGAELYVFGKNLTENVVQTFGARAAPTTASVQVSDPRTYGFGVRYQF